MIKLVILAEEPSMKRLLDGLLPRVLPAGVAFQVVPHEGKHDLEKSIPRKMRAWKEPDVHFIILRDQDSGDCRVVKERLRTLCQGHGRSAWTVRVVCRELESWVVGDPQALDAAFGSRAADSRSRRMRESPDDLVKPIDVIREHVPLYQKVTGAEAVGRHLDPDRNRSASFQVFLRTVRALTASA